MMIQAVAAAQATNVTEETDDEFLLDELPSSQPGIKRPSALENM